MFYGFQFYYKHSKNMLVTNNFVSLNTRQHFTFKIKEEYNSFKLYRALNTVRLHVTTLVDH